MAGEKWGPWKRAKDDEHFKPFIIQKFEREGTHDIGEFKDMPNFEEKYVVVDEKGGHHEFKGMSEAMRTAERMFKEWKKAQAKPKNASSDNYMSPAETKKYEKEKADKKKAIDEANKKRQKLFDEQAKAEQELKTLYKRIGELIDPNEPRKSKDKKDQQEYEKLLARRKELIEIRDRKPEPMPNAKENEAMDASKLNELKKKVLKSEAPAKVKLAAVKALDARCGAKDNATTKNPEADKLRPEAKRLAESAVMHARELMQGCQTNLRIAQASNDEVELEYCIKECKVVIDMVQRAMDV